MASDNSKRKLRSRSADFLLYHAPREPTGELELFRGIWDERPHRSQISGNPVVFHPATFAHVLAKGKNQYPGFKLYPKNIVIVDHFIADEHGIWDNNTVGKTRNDYREHPDWKFMFDLEMELKDEYSQCNGVWQNLPK